MHLTNLYKKIIKKEPVKKKVKSKFQTLSETYKKLNEADMLIYFDDNTSWDAKIDDKIAKKIKNFISNDILNEYIQNLLVAGKWLDPKMWFSKEDIDINLTKKSRSQKEETPHLDTLTIYLNSIIQHEIEQQDLKQIIKELTFIINNKSKLQVVRDVLKTSNIVQETRNLIPEQVATLKSMPHSFIERLIKYERYGIGKGELFLTLFTEAERFSKGTPNKAGDVILPSDGTVIEVKFAKGRIGKEIISQVPITSPTTGEETENLPEKYAPFLQEYSRKFNYLILFSEDCKKFIVFDSSEKNGALKFLQNNNIEITPIKTNDRAGSFKISLITKIT